MVYPNIEKERQRKGMLRSDVARRLNVSRDTYGDWQEGRFPIPANHVFQLSAILGCSSDYLMSGARVHQKYKQFRPVKFF